MKTNILILLLTIFLFSCEGKQKEEKKENFISLNSSKEKKQSKAQIILSETIKAHGGDLYTVANYAFEFRGNTYKFKNEGTSYEYRKLVNKKEIVVEDILKNNEFSRLVNKNPVELSEREIKSGTGALNSVIYFATLPYKLNDKATKVKYIEETIIKENYYDVLEITFNEEGGGEDHDDEFHYWINKQTKKIDYLAYNYRVNNGGVRFRSAYNRRVVDGITFQDYINYKATVGTPLKDLPKLYETDQLKELSRIKTENIINLNN